MKAITYQTSRGRRLVVTLAQKGALEGRDVWPRCPDTGEEFAQVHHGAHEVDDDEVAPITIGRDVYEVDGTVRRATRRHVRRDPASRPKKKEAVFGYSYDDLGRLFGVTGQTAKQWASGRKYDPRVLGSVFALYLERLIKKKVPAGPKRDDLIDQLFSPS